MSLDDLSKKIGYEFADIKLLELAITHKSADSKSNNERLEFLGDAILSTVVSEYLYTKFPYQKEGLLTRMRSHLVKGDTLTRIAYNLELTNFIKLSKGTAKKSSERKQSILEGKIKAIIGAVMLDSNWETSKKFV
jgi:dsRNA-specific ribonuclease